MSILSPKRQVTLPKELCDRLLVQPGDDLSFMEHNGCITIIKKTSGGSDAVLSHIKANPQFSEEQSLQDTLSKKRQVQPAGKRSS